MIVELSANLAALAERLGPAATENDAQDCIDNLLESGWGGWDTCDIPEDTLLAAVDGPVEGPNDD